MLLILWIYFLGILFVYEKFNNNNNNNNINDNDSNNYDILPTTFWTDRAIAYWSNFLHDDDDNNELRYISELILKQEAQLRAMKCVPRKRVFKVEDILNTSDLFPPLPLVPHQKIVLDRCLPRYSYCDTDGMQCSPIKFKKKLIAVFFLLPPSTTNETSTITVFNVLMEEHSDCACQCPAI